MLSVKNDFFWMRQALAEARRAGTADEVPVGAVLVQGGRLVARGRNRIRELRDPSAHAEILTLRAAGQKLKRERFPEAVLYTTLEPCPMCAGALVLARVKRVVVGALDPKAGAGGSVFNLLQHPRLNHTIEVKLGVSPQVSRKLLQTFFKKKREAQ